MCKAQKVQFGQAAAAALVASSLVAGVSRILLLRWFIVNNSFDLRREAQYIAKRVGSLFGI